MVMVSYESPGFDLSIHIFIVFECAQPGLQKQKKSAHIFHLMNHPIGMNDVTMLAIDVAIFGYHRFRFFDTKINNFLHLA
jgi:hypothetical protein